MSFYNAGLNSFKGTVGSLGPTPVLTQLPQMLAVRSVLLLLVLPLVVLLVIINFGFLFGLAK